SMRLIEVCRIRKTLAMKVIRTLDDHDAPVDRNPVETLHQSAGPANCSAHKISRLSDSKENLLCMLRKKSRSSLKIFCLLATLHFDHDCGTNRIPIAFLAAQTEGDRIADSLHAVAQQSDLRRITVFQQNFDSAVVIEIGKCEGAAVIRKVEP